LLGKRNTFSPLEKLPGVPQVESRIQSVATAVQSAASSVESNIKTDIDKLLSDISIPTGISIGTRRLCVKYRNSTDTCEMLPINIAKLLPDALATLFKSELTKLQEVQDKITATILGTTLIAIKIGLAFILITLTVFCVIAYPFPTLELTLQRRLFLILIPSGVSAVFLIIPPVMFSSIAAKLENLTSQGTSQFAHIAKGSAQGLSIIVLVLVIVSALVACYTMWKTPIPYISQEPSSRY
jgi:hypothetical protein